MPCGSNDAMRDRVSGSLSGDVVGVAHVQVQPLLLRRGRAMNDPKFYQAEWVQRLRMVPGAVTCTVSSCVLSGGYRHVGACITCGCVLQHATKECLAGVVARGPARRAPRWVGQFQRLRASLRLSPVEAAHILGMLPADLVGLESGERSLRRSGWCSAAAILVEGSKPLDRDQAAALRWIHNDWIWSRLMREERPVWVSAALAVGLL